MLDIQPFLPLWFLAVYVAWKTTFRANDGSLVEFVLVNLIVLVFSIVHKGPYRFSCSYDSVVDLGSYLQIWIRWKGKFFFWEKIILCKVFIKDYSLMSDRWWLFCWKRIAWQLNPAGILGLKTGPCILVTAHLSWTPACHSFKVRGCSQIRF